jgi:hypothetical protein
MEGAEKREALRSFKTSMLRRINRESLYGNVEKV